MYKKIRRECRPAGKKKENYFVIKGEKICFSFVDVIIAHELSQNCHDEMNFSEINY